MIQSLPKRSLYRSDPIARLLIERFHLSPLGIALLSIILGGGLYLLTAWVSDTLWTKPDQTGLLQDWFPWIWLLFIAPIVLGYYLWSFQAIEQVIQDLEASDVIAADETEILAINQIALSAYQIKWRKFLAIGCASVFSIFVFITRFGLKNSWTGSHPLPIAVITMLTFGMVYIGSTLILNLIANIWILHCTFKRELSRKEFNVNPLHPDRCGGLRSLSDYAIKTAYLAAALGIMVGCIEYQFIVNGLGYRYWFVHLIIPLDLLLSIACFFGPLVAAHRGMKRAKEDLLQGIARQFQSDYAEIRNRLTSDAETLKKGSEKIKELRALYTLTDEFPVWPFDVQTFRRFLLTVPAPLLPLLLGVVKTAAGAFLKKWGIDLG